MLVGFSVCVYGTDCDYGALSRKVVVVLVYYDAFDEGAFLLFEEHSVVKAYFLTKNTDEVSSQRLINHIETESILLNAEIVCNNFIFFFKLHFFHHNLNFGFEMVQFNYFFSFDPLEFF